MNVLHHIIESLAFTIGLAASLSLSQRYLLSRVRRDAEPALGVPLRLMARLKVRRDAPY